MEQRQIDELAAILIDQYGAEAPRLARRRQTQHAHAPRSRLFRTWRAIAQASERLLHRDCDSRPRRKRRLAAAASLKRKCPP